MEQDTGALRRMDTEFENSKKEQIMAFLRDQSKFNLCLNVSSEVNDVDDFQLISSISNTPPRLPLHSISRPKTASVSRKFKGDTANTFSTELCKSKTSQRPKSSYGSRRPEQLKVAHGEIENDNQMFRKRANTTEMSRIDEIDALSNASTRSVTPDLEDIDDSVFLVSPHSPEERQIGQVHPRMTYSTQKPDYIRRRVSSYSSEPNNKLKPIGDDLKQCRSGKKEKGMTKKNKDSKNVSSRKKNTNGDGVARSPSHSGISDDSVSNSDTKKFGPVPGGKQRSPGDQKSPVKPNAHGVVAIDQLPIDATTIGVQGIAMVECDASLYKQMRNKSAPNLRHTESSTIREPGTLPVYHLPPLEKTRPDGINNKSDVTSASAQVADLIRS